MEGYVQLSKKGGIAEIKFYHPAHNSLPSNLLVELMHSIEKCGTDPEVKLILIRSEGDRTFCSGASFTELSKIEQFEAGQEFFMGFARVINAIRKCPKVVVCRVHGKAVGGGVGLAAACDYALSTKYASVRLSELAVGIGPFVIGPAVARRVGLSAFNKLALTPDEWQTAEWAKDRGLFDESFDTVEQLDAYVVHFTEKLLRYHDAALSELKRIMWHGTEHWDSLLEERAAISGRLVLKPESKAAINAFLNV